MKFLKKFSAILIVLSLLFAAVPFCDTYVFAEEWEEEEEGDEFLDEDGQLKNDEDGDEFIDDAITDEEEPVENGVNEDLLSLYEGILNSDYVVNTSPWAEAEVKAAARMGLIPSDLKMKDLTGRITRREFAKVAVRAFEALSGTKVNANAASPFKDCYDLDVVKAYTLGIVNGTSATEFSPNALLTREQAAVMLTRAYKKAKLSGWSIENDSAFTLQYAPSAPFSDDADVSDYAKTSVYFMVSNGILSGVGNNNFAPKNDTTREQAIIITLRMVEKLK